MHHSLIAAVLLSLAATVASAAEPVLKVAAPWARATAPGAPNGGVFMKLENTGKTDDRLLKAGSDRARAVELHTHKMDGGIARMIEVPSIAVAAGKSVELKPGGLHVMLIGLQRPLKEGETFPLSLQFEKAGMQTVDVVVRGIGAGAEHSGHGKH